MDTEFGPTFGLLALNFSSAQGVIGGFSRESENASSYIVYFLALSGARRDRRQTPDRSTGGAPAWAFATPVAGV